MYNSTCPICSGNAECNETRIVKMSVQLPFTCSSCGLNYTIIASANAFDMGIKLNQIKLNGDRNGNPI